MGRGGAAACPAALRPATLLMGVPGGGASWVAGSVVALLCSWLTCQLGEGGLYAQDGADDLRGDEAAAGSVGSGAARFDGSATLVPLSCAVSRSSTPTKLQTSLRRQRKRPLSRLARAMASAR